MRKPGVLSVVVALVLGLVGSATAAAAATDGTQRRVTIIRDTYGVPHVYSTELDALFYGVGYAQAQDRLWQAETLRRAATGTLAEIGLGSVEGDVFARTMFGNPDTRAAQVAAADAETRTILESFAAGMSAFIEEATPRRLPIEFRAQGITPRPWTVDDSVATFMLLGSRFGMFGESEPLQAAALADLVERLGPVEAQEVWEDTHWLSDPSAPTTDPGGAAPLAAPSADRAAAPDVSEPALDRAEAAFASWEEQLAAIGLRGGPASNAIVIGSGMSADGHPLLLGGPQMGYTTPQINHEIGIHGAGFDVTGMEIAGWPGTPIGVGKGYAWTLTSGTTDNTDVYAEVLNPADPGQYLFEGTWVDFDCRTESIPLPEGQSAEADVCSSVHGPVIGADSTTALTVRSTIFGNEVSSYEAWLDLARASSIDDFGEALSGIAYNFNVLYADRRNIAYWHVGQIPVRADGDDPWLPHDGTGGAEWQGTIPWEEMPHVRNPAQGWMANWNNKPTAGWENSSGGFATFGPVHRVNTLFNLLEGLTPASATVQTLADINRTAGLTTDTPSGNASTVVVSTLLDELLDHVYVGADPRLAEVVDLLGDWDQLQDDQDGDELYDSPAVAVFNTWWQALSDRVVLDELGGTLDRNIAANVIARLLDDDPALPLTHDWLDGEPIDDAVTQALIAAVDRLTAEYGTDEPDGWLQPISVIRWASQGAGSVPDTLWMNRGTYNQIVHLGRGGALFGMNVVAPGQSGRPFSAHFDDQLPLYASWSYKDMNLRRADLRGEIERIKVLRLGG